VTTTPPTEPTGPTEPTEQQVADELEAFLREQFPATAGTGLRRDVDLFETGVVDSVGVAETLAHLEELYGVEIPDEVLLSDEFTSIDGIGRSIVGLLSGATTTP
jgi:acyl carrier protein